MLLLLLLLLEGLSIYCQLVYDIHSLLFQRLWLLELLCPPFPRGKGFARSWGAGVSSQPRAHFPMVTPRVDAFPDLPRIPCYLPSP